MKDNFFLTNCDPSFWYVISNGVDALTRNGSAAFPFHHADLSGRFPSLKCNPQSLFSAALNLFQFSLKL